MNVVSRKTKSQINFWLTCQMSKRWEILPAKLSVLPAENVKCVYLCCGWCTHNNTLCWWIKPVVKAEGEQKHVFGAVQCYRVQTIPSSMLVTCTSEGKHTVTPAHNLQEAVTNSLYVFCLQRCTLFRSVRDMQHGEEAGVMWSRAHQVQSHYTLWTWEAIVRFVEYSFRRRWTHTGLI